MGLGGIYMKSNDIEQASNFISKQGFPIFMCLVLSGFIYINYRDSKVRENRLLDKIERNTTIMESFDNTLRSIDIRLQQLERGGH